MKKALLTLVILSAQFGFGQLGNVYLKHFPGAPSGPCTNNQQAENDATGSLYTCKAGVWFLAGGGGGTGTITGSGTAGLLPIFSGATAIGNSLCDEGITTANTFTCADTAGIAGAGFTSTNTSVAGYVNWGQGPKPSAGTTAITEYAPASVTSYFLSKPGAAATGLLHWANSAGTVTESVSGVVIADLTATGTPSSTTFLRGDNTWGTPAGAGTVTSVGFTGGLISVGTPTSTPAFTVAGTSGGIPYFASSSTWASSGALTASALVLGGGAGASPTVLGSLGTATTLLHGNAAGAPTFGAVVNADITNATIDLTTKVTGVLPLANMSQLFVTNAQTSTYQVLAADFTGCKTIPVASGTFTITLVASGTQPASGKCIDIVNYGSGVVTVARSGQNINGAAANLTIAAGSSSAPLGMHIVSDGTDYVAQTWGAGAGGGATTALDNLASVAINTAPLPGTDNSIALGSATKRWTNTHAVTFTVYGATSGSAPITASATGGTLNLGSTGATVTSGGNITGNSISSNNSFSAEATSAFGWATRSFMQSPADGVIKLTNNAQTSLTRLDLGLTTSSGPAFCVSGTTITGCLGDGTAGGIFAASNFATVAAGSHFNTQGATTDIAGTVSIAASTSGTKTFTTNYTNAPNCVLTPKTDPTAIGFYWVTTTTSTVVAHVTISGTIDFTYLCVAATN